MSDVVHLSNDKVFPTNGQIITSSGDYNNTYYRKDQAFNDDLTNQWVTAAGNASSWLKVELPTAVAVYQLEIHPRLDHQKTTQYINEIIFLMTTRFLMAF